MIVDLTRPSLATIASKVAVSSRGLSKSSVEALATEGTIATIVVGVILLTVAAEALLAER